MTSSNPLKVLTQLIMKACYTFMYQWIFPIIFRYMKCTDKKASKLWEQIFIKGPDAATWSLNKGNKMFAQ